MIPSLARRREAFTLIELLIVISIIAILAGLAFPAVQGALGQGKKAQARNDVNQLAAAIKAFQLEYGRLPASSDSPSTREVISALIGSNATLNPRSIVFFEPKAAKGPEKAGWDGSLYRDPWGHEYTIRLDTDYDNKMAATGLKGLTNPVYYATAIIWSPGGKENPPQQDKDAISNVK